MEIRAQPTSLRLAPPPASASFRRTPLRTSFLKGNGACFDFVSHFYTFSVLWGDWYLRLLCGESVRAPNPLRTSLLYANLAEHLLSGMLGAAAAAAAAAIVEPV